MKGSRESSQKPVKIDGILWDDLDKWLKTPEAKNFGYHSKAQFTTEAVRELLEKTRHQRMLKDLKKFWSPDKGFDPEFKEAMATTLKYALKNKNYQQIKSLRKSLKELK